jgi:phage replication O-like protein O
MASPQAENGHIDIAHEIAEALMRVNLSAYESRVLWFIFRKTYGYKKTSDWLSLSQFSKSTGLDRRLVHRAIKKLDEKKMLVIQRDDSQRPKYGFQKNYQEWKLSSKEMTVIYTDDGVSSKEMTKVSSKEIPTKENLQKKTIQKKNTCSSVDEPPCDFDIFWKEYPRKTGKGAARKSWKKIKSPKATLDKIIAALAWQKKSEQWTRDNGQYIPHPSTYLNQERWEDEPDGNPANGPRPANVFLQAARAKVN